MMRHALLIASLSAAALPSQMGLRFIDRYDHTTYARSRPAVGTAAPDLRLWDLDGRPRSLALEHGRSIVLIGGSYT